MPPHSAFPWFWRKCVPKAVTPSGDRSFWVLCPSGEPLPGLPTPIPSRHLATHFPFSVSDRTWFLLASLSRFWLYLVEMELGQLCSPWRPYVSSSILISILKSLWDITALCCSAPHSKLFQVYGRHQKPEPVCGTAGRVEAPSQTSYKQSFREQHYKPVSGITASYRLTSLRSGAPRV